MTEKTKAIMKKNVHFTYVFLITMGTLNITMVYLWTRHAKGFKHPHVNNDISCFDNIEGDGLPHIDEELIKVTKSIFFLETSCRGYLDSIQACAVESAVREQFDWTVHVVYAGPVSNKTLNTGVMAALKKMNVHISRIKLKEALKGTPLERIAKDDLLRNSSAKVAHASDILRLYLLWKYSGIYMDLDVITLKSFSSLEKDFAAVEDSKGNNVLATGVISLSKSYIGRKIASLLVEELGNSFDSRLDNWSASGPALLTQVIWKLCNTTVPYMTSTMCQGFQVYDSTVFYPLEAIDYIRYLSTREIDLNGSYTIHIWNKLISTYQRIVPKNTLYDKIAKKYCPTVYYLTRDNLGV